MTSGDIETDVRAAITDPSATRWTAATLRLYIFAGETLIVDLHPEAQFHTRVKRVTPTLPTATTDVLTIDDSWRIPLTHYVAARCFAEDSDAEGNLKLSAFHYKLFEEAMA